MPRKRRTLLERFLTMFGDIKVFKWPLFVLFHPSGHRIKGEEIRALLRVLQPGDILVRKFDDYLDGRFIPGYFSHVGVYLGEIRDEDLELVPEKHRHDKRPDGKPAFHTGPEMVMHAVAEGVELQDILTFCRCDYLAVMRLPAVMPIGADNPVLREQAVPRIRAEAFRHLGRPYDFKFGFGPRRLNRLSCSELAYAVLQFLQPFHGIAPRREKVFGIFERSFIRPDAFVRAPLEPVWQSPSIAPADFAAARAGTNDRYFEPSGTRAA